jgi:formate hydrogenlyase subunit 6/NADH:ubiquinone oxidoreductase subunit I
VQAIVLGPEYEMSDTSREKFVFTKEKLLEPLPPDVEARLQHSPSGPSGHLPTSGEDNPSKEAK